MFFFRKKDHFGVLILFKKWGSRRKSSRQAFTKKFKPFFKSFLSFSVVSLHHKRNGTRLLWPQTESTQVISRIAEWRKTYNLWKWENLEKSQNCLQTLQFPVSLPKIKIWHRLQKIEQNQLPDFSWKSYITCKF